MIVDFTSNGAVVEFDSGVRAELLPVETPQYSCKIDKDENSKHPNKFFISDSVVDRYSSFSSSSSSLGGAMSCSKF